MNRTLSQLLKEVMGLNVTSVSKGTLQNALRRRMRELEIDDEGQYIRQLKTSQPEISKLIDEVVINETWFFRDEAPFTVLKSYAGDWLKKNSTRKLRLLSIPCATGEEPFSMAIALLEAGLTAEQFTITAIDISKKSINFAQKAEYGKRSFRGIDKATQQLYFSRLPNGRHRLNDMIRKTVRFSCGNLLHLSLPLALGGYNIIFCRNLLIYLDTASQKRAIDTLDQMLSDDGILFIGHAEPGLLHDTPFTPSHHPKAFSFVKMHAVEAAPEGRDTMDFTPREQGAEQEGARVAAAFDHGRFQEAQQLAGNGRYDEAVSICETLVMNCTPQPQVFMLLGMIFDEKDDHRSAVKMLKKAIYLNPNYLEALELLANIYKRQNDHKSMQDTQRRSARVKERLQAAKKLVKEVSHHDS